MPKPIPVFLKCRSGRPSDKNGKVPSKRSAHEEQAHCVLTVVRRPSMVMVPDREAEHEPAKSILVERRCARSPL